MPLLHLRRRLIVLALAAVVAIGFSAREFVVALVWSVQHHQLVTLPQGTSVRVAPFWTPAGETGAPNELRLRRANWGLRPSQEWIVLRTNTPPLLPDRQRQILQSLTHRIAPSSACPAIFSLPDDLKNGFQCLAPGVAPFPSWQLSCVSSDGFWALDLFGTPSSQHDLAPVLRNLGSAGKP